MSQVKNHIIEWCWDNSDLFHSPEHIICLPQCECCDEGWQVVPIMHWATAHLRAVSFSIVSNMFPVWCHLVTVALLVQSKGIHLKMT